MSYDFSVEGNRGVLCWKDGNLVNLDKDGNVVRVISPVPEECEFTGLMEIGDFDGDGTTDVLCYDLTHGNGKVWDNVRDVLHFGVSWG